MFCHDEHALFIFDAPVRHRIHGWFCQPLQLLYLDKKDCIMEIASLEPFQTHCAKEKYWTLVELSTKTPCRIGDRVSIIHKR